MSFYCEVSIEVKAVYENLTYRVVTPGGERVEGIEAEFRAYIFEDFKAGSVQPKPARI